jgi:transcription antitermination factor NusG
MSVGLHTIRCSHQTNEAPFWYAIHTRHQHEAAVQRQLEFDHIHSYLPMVDEVRQWSDRKKRIQVPLFSCFVFIRGIYSPQMHHAVIRKPGVVGFVGVGKRGLPIPDTEIDSIRRLLASSIPFSPYPFVNTGERVRIRGGALDNIEGIVVSNTGRKFIVSVETIQRSVAVQLEDASYGIEVISICKRPGRSDILQDDSSDRAVGMTP